MKSRAKPLELIIKVPLPGFPCPCWDDLLAALRDASHAVHDRSFGYTLRGPIFRGKEVFALIYAGDAYCRDWLVDVLGSRGRGFIVTRPSRGDLG